MKEEILKLRNEGKTYREISHFLKVSKSTIQSYCDETYKIKKREYDKIRRNKLKDKIKEQKQKWVLNNPEKIKESRERNKENKKISDKKYADKNRDKLNDKKKYWAQHNLEKVRISKTKHFLNKLKKDPLFKLKHAIGCSIRQAFKKNNFTKTSKSYQILGCSFEEFKIYLESKFETWMNWDNHGKYNGCENYGWDIDHIIPISTAVTEEDVARLNHYSNFQPLCSYINRYVKKNKNNFNVKEVRKIN